MGPSILLSLSLHWKNLDKTPGKLLKSLSVKFVSPSLCIRQMSLLEGGDLLAGFNFLSYNHTYLHTCSNDSEITHVSIVSIVNVQNGLIQKWVFFLRSSCMKTRALLEQIKLFQRIVNCLWLAEWYWFQKVIV